MARADCKTAYICRHCDTKAALTEQGIRFHVRKDHKVDKPRVQADFFMGPVGEYKDRLSETGLNVLKKRGGKKDKPVDRVKRAYHFHNKDRVQKGNGKAQIIGINTKSILIPVMLEVPIVIGQAQLITTKRE